MITNFRRLFRRGRYKTCVYFTIFSIIHCQHTPQWSPRNSIILGGEMNITTLYILVSNNFSWEQYFLFLLFIEDNKTNYLVMIKKIINERQYNFSELLSKSKVTFNNYKIIAGPTTYSNTNSLLIKWKQRVIISE